MELERITTVIDKITGNIKSLRLTFLKKPWLLTEPISQSKMSWPHKTDEGTKIEIQIEIQDEC